MTEFNPSLPIVQKSDSTEEPKVTTALEELKTIINGNIDKTNVAAPIVRAEAANKYQKKAFTKAEAETGVEISATRPAIGNFEALAVAKLEVGGKEAGTLGTGTLTAWVNAAEVWKTTVAITVFWRIL